MLPDYYTDDRIYPEYGYDWEVSVHGFLFSVNNASENTPGIANVHLGSGIGAKPGCGSRYD